MSRARKCIVGGCGNIDKDLPLFSWPQEKAWALEWCRSLSIAPDSHIPPFNTFVCRNHFKASNVGPKGNRLRKGAIPFVVPAVQTTGRGRTPDDNFFLKTTSEGDHLNPVNTEQQQKNQENKTSENGQKEGFTFCIPSSVQKPESKKLAVERYTGRERNLDDERENETSESGQKEGFSTCTPSSVQKPESKKLAGEGYMGREQNLDDERVTLTLLQQDFYREENRRAEEKHEQELIGLKLKNELLQLQIEHTKKELSASSLTN